MNRELKCHCGRGYGELRGYESGKPIRSVNLAVDGNIVDNGYTCIGCGAMIATRDKNDNWTVQNGQSRNSSFN